MPTGWLLRYLHQICTNNGNYCLVSVAGTLTFNQRVVGSSPTAPTIEKHDTINVLRRLQRAGASRLRLFLFGNSLGNDCTKSRTRNYSAIPSCFAPLATTLSLPSATAAEAPSPPPLAHGARCRTHHRSWNCLQGIAEDTDSRDDGRDAILLLSSFIKKPHRRRKRVKKP